MIIRMWLLIALVACNARDELHVGAGSYVEAQGATTGGGLYKVTTIDGGLCTGKGTKSDPLDCKLITDGTSITGNGSPEAPLSVSAAVGNAAFGMFGDGSDGDVIISADTTLDRDTMYRDLVVDDGIVLDPNGFRMWVSGTLTLNGKIARNGNNGENGPNGSDATGGNVADCNGTAAGGAGFAGKVLVASNAGASSAALATSPPSTTTSSTGFCPTHTLGNRGSPSVLGGAGGSGANGAPCRGGGGGGGGGSTVGGTFNSVAGGNSGGSTQISGGNGWKTFMALTSSRTDAGQTFQIGTGGGAGSCGRDNSTELNPGGGAGGAGGGYIVLMARTVTQGPNGGIEAKGGNGGDGGSCGTHTTAAGGGGGGGGGPGGIVVLVYNSGNPTVDVTGGIGGTGGSPCPAGGSSGGNGGNGADGAASVYRLGL